jgi:hypothetical protein
MTEYPQIVPTKIGLEKTKTHTNLRVFAPQTLHGSYCIESIPLVFKGTVASGDALPGLRKQARSFAKRFAIPFIDQTA